MYEQEVEVKYPSGNEQRVWENCCGLRGRPPPVPEEATRAGDDDDDHYGYDDADNNCRGAAPAG